MIVLAADIGGTKSLFQVTEVKHGCLSIVFERCFLNAEYASFDLLIFDFLSLLSEGVRKSIESLCLGVAGPILVAKQSAKITNLSWYINLSDVLANVSIEKGVLINDFEAIAFGIARLDKKDILILQEGVPQKNGNCSIIGAGTGLGLGLICKEKNNVKFIPSEGGHAAFSPHNLVQLEFLRYLYGKYELPSLGDVLSGIGLKNMYDFFRDERNHAESSIAAQLLNESDDIPATIYQLADEYQEFLSVKSLELFVEIYGGQAGDYSLTTLPYGGLYISGGIAPKITPQLVDGGFICAFNRNRKMRPLLREIPIYLIINPKVGLIGATLVAASL